MYIKANHFNYDKLLGGIVEHLDLQDTPLDDLMVSNVFKGFESTYKELRTNQKLEDWQESIVIEFISSIELMATNFSGALDQVLENIVDIFTGQDDGSLWRFIEIFMDRIELDQVPDVTLTLQGNFVLKDDIQLSPDVFAQFLKEWVESHLSHQLEGINGFLFDQINHNVLPREYMKDITILDIPGSKAKHGDTLITFPLILLEVHNR